MSGWQPVLCAYCQGTFIEGEALLMVASSQKKLFALHKRCMGDFLDTVDFTKVSP